MNKSLGILLAIFMVITLLIVLSDSVNLTDNVDKLSRKQELIYDTLIMLEEYGAPDTRVEVLDRYSGFDTSGTGFFGETTCYPQSNNCVIRFHECVTTSPDREDAIAHEVAHAVVMFLGDAGHGDLWTELMDEMNASKRSLQCE